MQEIGDGIAAAISRAADNAPKVEGDEADRQIAENIDAHEHRARMQLLARRYELLESKIVA